MRGRYTVNTGTTRAGGADPLIQFSIQRFPPRPNPSGLSHFDENSGHTSPSARGEARTPLPARRAVFMRLTVRALA